VDPNIVPPDELCDATIPVYRPRASVPFYGPTHPFAQRVEIDIPIEMWLTISDQLNWPQAILLANTCRSLDPLRRALSTKLQHLRMPDRVAEGLLAYRKAQNSKHLKGLIMDDGRRNTTARNKELEAGLKVFGQWWKGEPPAPERWREPQRSRHSELGYAAMCSKSEGVSRYWRASAVSRVSGGTPPLNTAYKEILTREANEMRDRLLL
jgi:hypothetical protein